MKHLLLTGMLGLALAGGMLAPQARADEWDQKMVLTVDRAVQIENIVLQPGQYVVKLVDSQSDRHIVQIFNDNETQLLGTVLAIPDYRVTPTAIPKFTFYETRNDQPAAMRSWFYPGESLGQRFLAPPSVRN